MCGICGYIGESRPELLEPMCASMIHRGPDDSGTWFDVEKKIGLGHRRLSILDLTSAGHQPMGSVDGKIWLSYNGEIYDCVKHRSDLIKRGYNFRGNSDTEVLLYLYEVYGDDFLKRINGMFSLAIWDSRRERLLLARDHAGVKPLYYWRSGERLFFSSELKSLLQVPEIPRELNKETLGTYLTLLWVPGNTTMLKGIEKLEPGHMLVWERGEIKISQWFTIDYSPENGVAEAEWIERVESEFMAVIERQMVSDVKVGAFLSGGLDSSAIVAAMRNLNPDSKISCYTTAYDSNDLKREGIIDDLPYAKKVAKSLGVDLNLVEMTPKVVELLPKMVFQMEEPDADPSAILTYLIAKLAHEDGTKVLMSGTGGDEVLFGYRSHQAYRRFQQLDFLPKYMGSLSLNLMTTVGNILQGAQGSIARRARKFRKGFLSDGVNRHLALVDWSNRNIRRSILLDKNLVDVANNHALKVISKYYDNFVGQGDINRHSHVLVQTFLAAHNFLYTDKCAMSSSVEVRVPYMDVEFMKLCASIPENIKLKGNITKFVLKKSMEKYLPKDVLYRPKTGFAPPIREWIITGLSSLIDELLSEKQIIKRGLFDYKEVAILINENRNNVADHGYLIYALLSLEIWCQTFLDRPAVEVEI